MSHEIIIPEHFPELKEENIQAAAKRREKYSLRRDLLAEENNRAIIQRIQRDKEKPGQE